MRKFSSTDEAIDHLRQQCANFRQTFDAPTGREVRNWMKDFCRADKSCFHENPYAMAAMEGRRDVWVAINQRLTLEPHELFFALGGQAYATNPESE